MERNLKCFSWIASNAHYEVDGIVEPEGKVKKLRWGLGKDDISVADLFKAFSETGTRADKTEIAKYCFQDCNLVHHLFRKNDVWTGMVEQAAICSIPNRFCCDARSRYQTS